MKKSEIMMINKKAEMKMTNRILREDKEIKEILM